MNKCIVCNKRLALLPFKCKCGVVTCVKHKWPEHECTFDYRAEGLERLKKDNPRIASEKLVRI